MARKNNEIELQVQSLNKRTNLEPLYKFLRHCKFNNNEIKQLAIELVDYIVNKQLKE